jgi:hypothetical protein
MKKMLALLLVVVALGFAFRAWKSVDQRDLASVDKATDAAEKTAPSAQAKTGSSASSSSAGLAGERPTGEQGSDALATHAAAPARPSTERFTEYKGMFADAPVISSMVEYGPEPGQETAIRIVETKMKQPFVKIREIYEERNGTRVLVDQQAMVANQLMLQRPAGVEETAFVEALRNAGAKELKTVGDTVVATFESRPHDPKALDDYLSKVRELVGAEVTVEYNYIRKLI